MAARRAPRTGTAARAKKVEPARVRYLFYLILVALFASIPVSGLLYLSNTISSGQFNAYSSMALSLLFSFSVLAYLLAKGRRLGDMVKELGLSRESLTARNIMIGAALFALVVFIGALLQEVSNATGIPLPTNVAALLSGMPLSFLVFSFIVAPVNEEVLFRGFLVPRVGILFSALLFAIPHLLAYSSVSELAAALAFGIAAGYVFRKTGSLYPSIMAHMLVNLLAVLSFL